jgi:hypothetical protein
MPVAVQALLQSRCETCHQYGQRDPSGWGSVLDLSRMIDAQIVVPGDPDRSRMWHRTTVRNDMPFNGSRLTREEKLTVRSWIESLQRPFQRPRTQAQILDHLVGDQAAAGNASDTRYVSFAHFVDGRRPPEEIRAAGVVFKVVLNSLSRRPGIVEPVAVDREGSIWRFRLRDLGWSERDWSRLVSFDPYCLRSDNQAHLNLYQRLGTEAPIVRGDWFVSTALQAPLYNDLMNLGESLDEIVRLQVGVDINENIARGNVQRIAMDSSGVWLQGQVVERHAVSGGGYLWLRYALTPGEDVRRNPLGPRNRNNDFPHSFSTTATEAIWSLPNGLQAYAQADANGNRVESAPISLSQDPRNKNGSVENATSCTGCHGISGLHHPGMAIDFSRHLQRPNDFSPAEIEQIRRIYPVNGEQILAADGARYRETIRGLHGYHLVATSTGEWDDFITLRGQYESKVGLRQGAIELGSDLTIAQWEVRTSGIGEPLLPLTVADPLVARNEWICRFRQIARDVRGASFCAGTFTAPQLARTVCDRL